MVLTDKQKRWASLAGGILFVLAQFSFFIAGFPDRYTYDDVTVVLVISDDCMSYITQSPIQKLPSNKCIREIKYLQYRIELLLIELENVESRNSTVFSNQNDMQATSH